MRENYYIDDGEKASPADRMEQAAITRETLVAPVRTHSQTLNCYCSIIRFWICLKTQERLSILLHLVYRRAEEVDGASCSSPIPSKTKSHYRIREISHGEYVIFYVCAVVRLWFFARYALRLARQTKVLGFTVGASRLSARVYEKMKHWKRRTKFFIKNRTSVIVHNSVH